MYDSANGFREIWSKVQTHLHRGKPHGRHQTKALKRKIEVMIKLCFPYNASRFQVILANPGTVPRNSWDEKKHDRMPSLELVIQIVELTDYSLDCLIFGEYKTEKIKDELQMAINTLSAIKRKL